ncbi:transcriptional regulator with XRE-family HTH domain [Gluconobacter cerinus]|uniref:helix-turn-helix domain-containing protein n=1 Tax=Gluconobacter cerinus TaxID=38307 RepID=UPI0022268C1D|nr:helix-turn-helix domain-containing protein [Gluconobacter cerinus]MCW2266271.1 transcriptional regulator with XRE-family HTH domain [Gluconobacter cerinus]
MNLIDAFLTQEKMSARALAEKVGVSAETVRLWRIGKRRVSIRNIAAFCVVSGMRPEQIRPDIFLKIPEKAA